MRVPNITVPVINGFGNHHNGSGGTGAQPVPVDKNSPTYMGDENVDKYLQYEKTANDLAWERTQQSAQTAMQFSREENEKNRQFQERMANTSYQRAMADAQKAGINPMLIGSLGGGATSPTGGTATSHSASAPKEDMLQAYMFTNQLTQKNSQFTLGLLGKIIKNIFNGVSNIASKL